MTKLNFQEFNADSVYFLKTLFLHLCSICVIVNDQTDDLKKIDY